MTIVHSKDFLFSLFPEAKGDSEKLIDVVKRYYSVGPFDPEVTQIDDEIHINIDVNRIESEKREYDKLVTLAESRQFDKAEKLAKELIEKSPNVSEYYRILGQIYSEKGDHKAAIDALIDALKWNPQNTSALIMMGNEYAREMNDLETALTYYQEAIKHNPDDYIAINNIGANLLQNNRVDEAINFFEKALQINSEYPNTLLGLSMSHFQNADYKTAFNYAIKGIKVSEQKNEVFKRIISSALEAGRKISSDNSVYKLINDFKKRLESISEKEIHLKEDDSISTTAKFELAENYDRDNHIVRYKSNREGYQHLIMHELVHLDFILQARKSGVNKLFTSNEKNKKNFMEDNEATKRQLKKKGLPENSAIEFLHKMFNGLNNQIYNTPIDLFIEDFLFEEYEELRPVQFVSLYQIYLEGLQAVTDDQIEKFAPKSILRPSKVLNMVLAHQFKDLYGINLLPEYKSVKIEEREVNAMYEEWLDYKDDRQPGEEYELIQHWGEDLKLENYFELVDEKAYQDRKGSSDEIIKSIEEDPFGVSSDVEAKEEEMKKFLESHKADDINMAVAMYMVDALEHFQSKSNQEIKKIAHEIAMLGTQGIDPKKKGYNVNSIPQKSFSGYHLLAYYYVSWAIAIPEMLDKLGMPFDKEYDLANQFYKQS